MKKLSTIIMALALVLGMSQCKKQETPTSTGNNTEGTVHITVKVDGKDGKDNNGEKHNIAPANGLFAFSNDDIIYVGHGGKYVGQLTFNNGFFGGDITPVTGANDNLHFYFLGGMTPATTPEVGTTENFTISIADQSGNLPVLSYGASTTQFTDLNTTYSTTLKNKCALVRFDLQNEGDYVVTLSNVPTQATVNFANPTPETAIVATEGQTNGNITLYRESGNTMYRWAILLPGTNLSTGHSDLNTTTYSGNVNLAELGTNDYVNSGISINNPLPLPDPPAAEYAVKTSDGTLTQFSVSPTKKVYFSKANLTWNETDGYHFHDTQLDEEHSGGSSVMNFDLDNLPDQGDVTLPNLTGLDRFTWGHIPNQSINSSYYITNNQLSAGLDPEWGKQMTGEGNDQWRTLTADEWNYLLHQRSGNRFMLVSVLVPITYRGNTYPTDIPGLLLFPDNFDYSGLGLTQASGVTSGIGFWPGRINKVYGNDDYQPASGNYTVTYDSYMDAYTTSIVAGPYKLIETANNLEHLYTNPSSNMYKLLAAGCVFLPAVGCREGAMYKKYHYYQTRNHAAQGFYWAADRVISGTSENAKYFWFGYVGGSNVETNPRPTFEANNTQHRSLGCCVRLVWDAN